MSSSSYAHSTCEEQQPRHFSVPLPTTDRGDGPIVLKLKCWHTHCAVHVRGAAIYLYSLPDFVLQRIVCHPSGIPPYDFYMHNTLLAVVFCDGTVGIWDVSEARCRSITRVMGNAGIEHMLHIRVVFPGLGQADASSNSPSTEDDWAPGEAPMLVLWIDDCAKAKCRIWRLPHLEEQDTPTDHTIMAKPAVRHNLRPVREIDTGLRLRCYDTFGSTTAASFADRTIRVWDLMSGRCKWVLLVGDRMPASALRLDSSKLCSILLHGDIIRVWDLRTGECLHILESSSVLITSVFLKTDMCNAFLLSVWGTVKKPNIGHFYLQVDDQKTILEYQDRDLYMAGFVLWNTQSGGPLGHYALAGDMGTAIHRTCSGPRFCIALVERRDSEEAYYLEVLDFGVDDATHSDNPSRPSGQDEEGSTPLDEEDSTPLEQDTKWDRIWKAGCGILYYVLVASVLYFSS
ncbi:hypothetical protein CVT26_012804 [Gymnopilus dilepis]|uniref:Anaphase-promoting complex subunit 4 WD40 domain-containing protein n=1 Tax=Gymnopilus dilepis TaxID=231916 RepID=A0A409Y409_9AGAR|nr:hypothetical protein CVT26_012804 [Gymnopilus dilepis]